MVTIELKTAARNGVNLRYLDTGEGHPPVVFVHGWTCDLSHWRNQVTEFSRDHRVVALDLRGHGESDKPDQDYTIAGFAEDVVWLSDELGLDRPVVIGHSMGGVIATQLARKHPDATRGIVLVDAPIVPFALELKPVADGVVLGLRSPAYKQIAEGFLRQFMFNEASDVALKEEIVTSSLKTPQRVMHSSIAGLFASQISLGGPLPVPALFIRASTAYATANEIQATLPGIEVAEVDCPHFVQLERPQETNGLIRRFLENLR